MVAVITKNFNYHSHCWCYCNPTWIYALGQKWVRTQSPWPCLLVSQSLGHSLADAAPDWQISPLWCPSCWRGGRSRACRLTCTFRWMENKKHYDINGHYTIWYGLRVDRWILVPQGKAEGTYLSNSSTKGNYYCLSTWNKPCYIIFTTSCLHSLSIHQNQHPSAPQNNSLHVLPSCTVSTATRHMRTV